MRTSKAHFKYALRFAKNQEETAKADALARDLIDKDVDNFWKTVYKIIFIIYINTKNTHTYKPHTTYKLYT